MAVTHPRYSACRGGGASRAHAVALPSEYGRATGRGNSRAEGQAGRTPLDACVLVRHAVGFPAPPLVLSGHAASLTPYQSDTPRPFPRTVIGQENVISSDCNARGHRGRSGAVRGRAVSMLQRTEASTHIVSKLLRPGGTAGSLGLCLDPARCSGHRRYRKSRMKGGCEVGRAGQRARRRRIARK